MCIVGTELTSDLLSLTVEEALRFALSAGVIVPPSQLIATSQDPAVEPSPQIGGTSEA